MMQKLADDPAFRIPVRALVGVDRQGTIPAPDQAPGPQTDQAAVPAEPPPDQGTAAPYPQAPQPDQGAIAQPGTEQPSTTPGMPGSDVDEQDVE